MIHFYAQGTKKLDSSSAHCNEIMVTDRMNQMCGIHNTETIWVTILNSVIFKYKGGERSE
jgi:hypothetical protein